MKAQTKTLSKKQLEKSIKEGALPPSFEKRFPAAELPAVKEYYKFFCSVYQLFKYFSK